MTRQTFEQAEKELRDWYQCRLLRRPDGRKGYVVETLANSHYAVVHTFDEAFRAAQRWERAATGDF